MTAIELKEKAKKNNFEFTEQGSMIGIRKKHKNTHVWYWFEIIRGNAHWNHSYSMNTGKTNRSYNEFLKITHRLEK